MDDAKIVIGFASFAFLHTNHNQHKDINKKGFRVMFLLTQKIKVCLSCLLASLCMIPSWVLAEYSLYEEIDCGMKDLTPTHAQTDFSSGFNYQQAKREVMNHLFKPKSMGSFHDNILAYFDELLVSNLDIHLSDTQLALLLCTRLRYSVIERRLNFQQAGLGQMDPNQSYLFYLKLSVDVDYLAHLWYLVDRRTGDIELVALDD